MSCISNPALPERTSDTKEERLGAGEGLSTHVMASAVRSGLVVAAQQLRMCAALLASAAACSQVQIPTQAHTEHT